jgi:hypothetical protein
MRVANRRAEHAKKAATFSSKDSALYVQSQKGYKLFAEAFAHARRRYKGAQCFHFTAA